MDFDIPGHFPAAMYRECDKKTMCYLLFKTMCRNTHKLDVVVMSSEQSTLAYV